MIRRLLIANRGEIAVRIIRACRDLGIESVVTYSEIDRDSMPVRLADRAVCIGPGPAKHSYLDIPAILAAASGTHADAVHPGYGFLAENPLFAERCEQQGLIFVGPTVAAMRLAGDKVKARETVVQANVPIAPGSDRAMTDIHEAQAVARRIGMPILLKAKGGGGGRGMRLVRQARELRSAWGDASREAEAAFGDGALYMERYLDAVRHIEIQILADAHGQIVALGERDCSVQRRHQKLIEEAPSPVIDAELREEISAAAVRTAQAVGYVGAGTIEFLFDLADRRFYFIEMNTRIQVEHPVTEMLTGVDLVAEQILIASGEPLSARTKHASIAGHAIECRINAEDPSRGFAPRPGTLERYQPPGGLGVRIDSHCYQGYQFPPHYDSLLAKVIIQASDRNHALQRMRRALQEFDIQGVPTTIPLHLAVLNDRDFIRGDITTTFLEHIPAGRAALKPAVP